MHIQPFSEKEKHESQSRGTQRHGLLIDATFRTEHWTAPSSFYIVTDISKMYFSSLRAVVCHNCTISFSILSLSLFSMEVGADPQTTPHGFPWHREAFLCGLIAKTVMVWHRVSQCESAWKDTHQAQSSCTHDTGLYSYVQHQLWKHFPIIPVALLAPVKDLVNCHHFCMSSSLGDKNKYFLKSLHLFTFVIEVMQCSLLVQVTKEISCHPDVRRNTQPKKEHIQPQPLVCGTQDPQLPVFSSTFS